MLVFHHAWKLTFILFDEVRLCLLVAWVPFNEMWAISLRLLNNLSKDGHLLIGLYDSFGSHVCSRVLRNQKPVLLLLALQMKLCLELRKLQSLWALTSISETTR